MAGAGVRGDAAGLLLCRGLELHGLGVESVPVVEGALLLGAVASAVVGLGLEIAVDDFANVSVFDLDLVAEADGLLCGLGAVAEEVPLEDGDAGLGSGGEDDVERDVVGIAVQHPVGEDPEVFGSHVAFGLLVAAVHGLLVFGAANR